MQLKKMISSSIAAVALVLSLASCSSGTNEYHTTYFNPLRPNGIEMFADQTIDSTRIVSTDNWSFQIQAADWLTATYKGQQSPFSETVKAGYLVQSDRITLTATPNTTGKERGALLSATSAFSKIGTTMTQVRQYPMLNITTPSCEISTENNQKQYIFRTYVDAAGKTSGSVNPKVTFTVYADGATLRSNDEWITVMPKTLGKENVYTPNEKQEVNLAIAENKGTEKRTGTLTLTSNGISNTITIVQAAPTNDNK